MTQKNNIPKVITHHRALAYVLQDRVIASYGKMMGKEYRNLDSISGQTAWCDFVDKDEWGEITLAYQENLPVQWLLWSLFSLNIAQIEQSQHGVQIDPKTIPDSTENLCVSPTVLIDTQSAITAGLEKKLVKKYPYQKNGFSKPGTLVLAIFDPSFEGFINNLEIRFGHLDLAVLQKIADSFASTSCFDRIFLVDGLSPFYENPENCTYELLKRT